MDLKFRVRLKIRKPVAQVFDAVVDPDKLSGYFVQRASAPIATATEVQWKFQEVPNAFPVQVHEVVLNERIVLEWESGEGGYNTHIEMRFEPLDASSTMVEIRESGWKDTEKGRDASYDNCSGWMHMMACLKGYLEYGINLREGGAL